MMGVLWRETLRVIVSLRSALELRTVKYNLDKHNYKVGTTRGDL